jgi:hypothetical protein
MGSHKFKVNWLNIITIKEFQIYLDTALVSEISLASKVVREKLMPLVFKNFKISNLNLNFSSNNIFTNHYRYFQTNEFDCSEFKDSANYSINAVINDFTIALRSIKKYAKSLHFFDFSRPGVYMFPVINVFNNLTRLQLGYNIMIPYSGFFKLGESLRNLTYIKLSADLLKLPNENFLPEDYIFPINLKHLEIIDSNIITTSRISDPYSFLFDRGSSNTVIDYFTLPKISIPSLTELVFYGSMTLDQGLEDFLEVNPDLESLSIRSANLKSIKTLSTLKTLKLDGSIRFNISDQIPALKSLKSIHIISLAANDLEYIMVLCSSCINLELVDLILFFTITDFQQFIDNILAPAVSNLARLKTLQLFVNVGDVTDLKLSKLYNIETLILRTQEYVIFNLDFISCIKLKKVVFKTSSYKINTKKYKDKFNNYKNWTFKFEEYTIKGYKIN